MDLFGNTGPKILKDNASEEKGESARLSSFVGAIVVADLVKTTLGPKGMDKILQPMQGYGPGSKITVTNDGATILKSVYVDNAAAKVLIEISKTQDDEVGDGTTTVAVLGGELLRNAEILYNKKIHPQAIIEGQRMARERALEALQSISRDNSENQESFRTDLLNIARTTLSSKLLTQQKEHFAQLCVDAVLRLKGVNNLDLIKIIKKAGGSLKNSFLADGFILEKSITTGCPKLLKNPRIMVANTSMDNDKIKIYGTKVRTDSFLTMAEIENAEKQKMKNKIDKILSQKPDVFINRQLIYNYPEQLFVDKGVMVIEHADFDGVERLAAVTGADILSTFNDPNTFGNQLGTCDTISEIMIGEDKLIFFKGCKQNSACTIILRGSSSHILEEAERSLHDVLCVLTQTVENSRVIWGGGNSEIQMSNAVQDLANHVCGKRSLAIEAYANALRQLPIIVADNAGLDSSELISNLKSEIQNGDLEAGIDINNGCVGNMRELGVTECYKVKKSAVNAASEAAEQLLRVDNIIRCAPRERKGQ